MITINSGSQRQDPWQAYYGPNLGYVQEQYERFLKDPSSVEPGFRELFGRHGAPPARSRDVSAPQEAGAVQAQQGTDYNWMQKVVAAHKLLENVRVYGHLAATIDPLGLGLTSDTRLLEPQTFQLTEEDLSSIPAHLIWPDAHEDVANGLQAYRRLRQIYTESAAYEFAHVHEQEEREWLNARLEKSKPEQLDTDEKTTLLNRLIQTEQFEHFLHRTFTGQKRFSVEGLEVLIPMLDELVMRFSEDGAERILMGMAHRGRLNVLAHILGKPYSKIFSEFHHAPNKDLMPSEGSMGINFGWTGDVKYHLGGHRSFKAGETVTTRLTLANNPSHLEFVNPIVEGFTRAAQEDRTKAGYPEQNVAEAATVLVHGDAAFPGEGIVAETLNFNQLPGYRNGGTVHIIANNRLGFTTESHDSRSTHYASDLAKGYEIPIVHVNADDPETCLAVVRLACEYRTKFKKDFLIDLIGYRRYGHNEMDDPEATQPLMYGKVHSHPSVTVLYGRRLTETRVVDEAKIGSFKDHIIRTMESAYEQVKQNGHGEVDSVQDARDEKPGSTEGTAVRLETLKEINGNLLKWPDGFKVYPKLRRILERRKNALEDGQKVDWALAETLAFATILDDGTPIRLSGQDSERGTFAHRHIVLHDYENGSTYSPLHQLPSAKASFAVHNSPLSEASVLGFEYGYNVFAPETLVLWEAQYGDFTNAAQVIIDQFISAGREKWSQHSGLVMLLPHGYEGQGPEHSSARLERYLTGAAENNWTVANLTSAAQYFHLLRRQAAMLQTKDVRPLILMAPKSLIRNPRVASPASAFAEGGFQEVLEEQSPRGDAKGVTRLLLCTGKVAVDLQEAIDNAESGDLSWVRVVRVEQLYPFPKERLSEICKAHPGVKELVWVQEEPENMGAWRYAEPRLRAIAPKRASVSYIGRPERSSTASGYQYVHAYEQQRILSQALKQS
ncbi:2-oxoglutarate dehydrogenase E1 component [Paenibacillus sp. IB182496]|uniref:2-oxoglutarate dehydrogenase E1 component n=1 Tax=Paenibacillus sabuli TaxID=2772509 RepID=A0A927BSQ6_9BACL|nr:2-oxoglutarate dehydrogenase E1 component [Paenibacillus sabuli]MBD2846086.1 2-oxoglutarate dehydrogenase E1 component [Paenibacillus sabuli]